MASSEYSVTEEVALRELDPSIRDGFRVIYDRECPFEMRVQEADGAPQEVGTLEAIRAKVLIQGDPSDPRAVKVELSSEADLFFHYVHVVRSGEFEAIQEEQKLMVDFRDYSSVLCRSLNNAIKEPHSYLAVFVMHPDGHARLDFIQNMEYKFVELLSCNFVRTDDETVRQHITFRYNALKSKLAVMQARLQDVQKIVQSKNPSLLLQLQKTVATSPSGGGGGGGGGGVPAPPVLASPSGGGGGGGGGGSGIVGGGSSVGAASAAALPAATPHSGRASFTSPALGVAPTSARGSFARPSGR